MSGEPTIKDVLEALAKVQTDLNGKIDAHRAETRADSRELRGELSRLDARVGTLDTKVDALRTEMVKRFAALDVELGKHSDPVHRDLEACVTALEKASRRPAPRATRTTRRR
jgi:uncharacterized coiled-coil DUF342 family protein